MATLIGYTDPSCPPNDNNYETVSTWSIIVSSIPVIGPAISGYIPQPPNFQGKLDTAQANLLASTQAWRSDITSLVIKDNTDINNLITTIIGTGNKDDYATITAEYILQPVAEQVTINTINIGFLALMISLVIIYILSNKKS